MWVRPASDFVQAPRLQPDLAARADFVGTLIHCLDQLSATAGRRCAMARLPRVPAPRVLMQKGDHVRQDVPQA